MFEQDPTYVNGRILVAYVREIVKRKTVNGAGHEYGVTIEEIFDEISFIFHAQYGQCPISVYDVAKALTAKENEKNLFSCYVNFEQKTLWRLNKDTDHPQIFFEPIKQEVREKPKTLNVSIDYESMLKSPEELANEVEQLREKVTKLERTNDELRAKQRLLIEPHFLDQTIRDLDSNHYSITDTYELVCNKVLDVIDAIDDALYY